MDEWEQRLWMDQVPVTNRSAKHPVEFTFDGNPIVFKAGETRSLPRHIAVFGIDKTPITTDPRTGATLDSFLTFPDSGIADATVGLDPVAVAEDAKTVEPVVMGPGGTPKRLKKLEMTATRESFAQNNEGGGSDLVGIGEK